MTIGCSRPQEHPLWLGHGRRDLPDRSDHCRHGRRTRCVHRAVAKGIRLVHGGDFLGAVIRFILFGLMAPFAAALHNRFGLRNVTLSALVIVASALVISLKMTELWQLMLLWGVAIGLGTGMTALVLGPPWPRAGSQRGAGWRWAFSPQPWPRANWCSCRLLASLT